MSTQTNHEVRAIAELALAATADQFLVPQSHHVDVLLDLRSAATSVIVRSTIDERLREIRFVSMLFAEEVRADLHAIAAISELDDPYDLTWAEEALALTLSEGALACECDECAAAEEHAVQA